MARSIWTGLFVGLLSLPASASDAIQVAIDVQPGEAGNVVDRDAAGTVAVALFGSAELDVRSVDPASLRFAGAPIVKDDAGETHRLEDVDGDGRVDLVVRFSTRQLRIDDTMKTAALEGSTREGVPLVGRDAIQTVAASLRAIDTVSVDEKAPSPVAAEAQKPALTREPGPSTDSRSTGAITIFDTAPAGPYPSTINISGINGVVSKLRVTLSALSHTCYGDLDIMLVGPTGQSLVLMSDVGGCGNLGIPVTMTFDDFAPTAIAAGVIAGTGTYRPFNSGGGDVYPAPAPAPSAATALSAFNGTNPNGEWKLYVVDDAGGDTGAILEGWTLDLVVMTQVCNPAPITVPRSSPDPSEARADLYPSWMVLSGLPTQIAKVSVTLKGVTHASPDDLEILLHGSFGSHSMVLMGHAGGTSPVSDLDLTFDDDASGFIPDGNLPAWSDVYRPATYGGAVSFPAPAPSPPYYSDLALYNGYDPNGTWNLYVVDHTAGGTGVIAEGWCVNVTAIAAADNCTMGTILIPGGSATSGPADPYPSTLAVAGTAGVILRAKVKLVGLFHTFPDDLDIAVQAPSGKTMWLMSDAGGPSDANDLDITFDQWALNNAPDEDPLGSGPYAPTDYEEGETLFFPAPPRPYAFSMQNELPNGVWRLWVNDDLGGDLGALFGWCLNFELYDPAGYRCSDGAHPLNIPTGAPQVTFGPASPYPWPVVVQQDGLIIDKLIVHVWSLQHTYADDLDILVVGPQGQKAMLMSDAGGFFGLGHDLAFDDEAALIPNDGPVPMGKVHPTDWVGEDTDAFDAPAPAGPYGTSLSVFEGTDPKGAWSLYVRDDAGGDIGSAMQWCLEIVPRYPASEVTNLRWRATKTALDWDLTPNAIDYELLRGTPDQLPNLLTAGVDSCQAASDHRPMGEGLNGVPPVGSFYWYLAIARSGLVRGPAGRALITGSETARTADTSGFCAVP
jgi:subtilisin-like proprotein convertase family protein